MFWFNKKPTHAVRYWFAKHFPSAKKLRTPNSELRTRYGSRGFTYIALLVAIVILGIMMGAAGKYWSTVMQRDKEAELLFRGDQYRKAIERYFFAIPGRMEYPQSIEDLLTDNRTAIGKRHLRQKFKDPITVEDFAVMRDQTKANRIVGVHSTSERKPLKQANFSDANKDFEGKTEYKEWKFTFTAPAPQPPGAGRPPAPGMVGHPPPPGGSPFAPPFTPPPGAPPVR